MTIKVLLADDHHVLRDGLRYLLDSHSDIAVIGDASNGVETLHATIRLRPDIVLMDIAMPELSGIEATHEIQQHSPSIGIIILSMHSSVEHIVHAFQAGARGYLLKDSAGTDVVNAIRLVYEGHCYLSPKISDTLIEQYVRKSTALDSPNPLSRLSHREGQVLRLVADGKSNTQIAEILSLSPKTVETYRSRLMHKLEITDLASLVKLAIKHGVTTLD